MKERPILFNDAMVRAILSGAKTQTRRPVQSPAKNMQREGMEVIKRRAPGDMWYGDHVWSMRGPTGVWGDYTDDRFRSLCPFGVPGDLLWVRECHGVTTGHRESDLGAVVRYRADGEILAFTMPAESALPLRLKWEKWRPSIHMPRWASRLTLRVTDVRVERVQDITEADARAEGLRRSDNGWTDGSTGYDAVSARHAFGELWSDTYGPESWDANPWVWAIGFEVVP